GIGSVRRRCWGKRPSARVSVTRPTESGYEKETRKGGVACRARTRRPRGNEAEARSLTGWRAGPARKLLGGKVGRKGSGWSGIRGARCAPEPGVPPCPSGDGRPGRRGARAAGEGRPEQNRQRPPPSRSSSVALTWDWTTR